MKLIGKFSQYLKSAADLGLYLKTRPDAAENILGNNSNFI